MDVEFEPEDMEVDNSLAVVNIEDSSLVIVSV